MTDSISKKDKKDWENFIASKEKLLNKDTISKSKKHLRTRTIDLHGYTIDQANKTIENFITKSFEEKINKLIVVTGKGLHSQNEKNPYVSKNLSILNYCTLRILIRFTNIRAIGLIGLWVWHICVTKIILSQKNISCKFPSLIYLG